MDVGAKGSMQQMQQLTVHPQLLMHKRLQTS